MGRAGGSTYREQPAPAALHRAVACTYSDAIGGPRAAYEHRILVNPYVDVLWSPGCDLFVTGPDTLPRTIVLERGATFYGVRCRPGHATAVLGVPTAELADWQGPLPEIWGREAERLADVANSAPSPGRGFALVRAALAARVASAPAPDPVVVAALEWLGRRRRAAIGELGASLGVSERQLRRRFTADVGMGPKTFHGVARVRRFLALVGCRAPSERALDALALEAGYADQSHLTREFRRLTGLAPVAHFADERSWA